MAKPGAAYTKYMILTARVECAGASDAGIKLALYDVLDSFLDFTSAWNEAIPITTVANQTDYPVTPAETPPGRIIRLAGVVDGNTIPQPAAMPVLGTVTLRDAPNASSTFTATVTKSVTLDGCDDHIPAVPDWIMQRWMPAVMHLLLAKLMLTPGKPYSNEATGAYNKRLGEAKQASARGAILRRNTYGTNAWVYPQSFRSQGQRGGVSVGNSTEF